MLMCKEKNKNKVKLNWKKQKYISVEFKPSVSNLNSLFFYPFMRKSPHLKTFIIKADEMLTREQNHLDKGGIWRELKALAEAASPGRKPSHLQHLTFSFLFFFLSFTLKFWRVHLLYKQPCMTSIRTHARGTLKGPYGWPATREPGVPLSACP